MFHSTCKTLTPVLRSDPLFRCVARTWYIPMGSVHYGTSTSPVDQDTIQTFYDITKREVETLELKMAGKDRDMELMEDNHR